MPAIAIHTVTFDKDTQQIIEKDPLFDRIFVGISNLQDLNNCLAKNCILGDDFFSRLTFDNKNYHLGFRFNDRDTEFEFSFFLAESSWGIVNQNDESFITDPLTKLPNKRAITEAVHLEIYRALRSETTFATILVDVEHLSNINEMFGYLAGDYVLKESAKIIKNSTRSADIYGRFEGDSFLIVLHQSDVYGTTQYIKKLESKLYAKSFSFNAFEFDVTFNFGVTLFKDNDSFETLIERLQQASQQAKKSANEHVKYLI